MVIQRLISPIALLACAVTAWSAPKPSIADKEAEFYRVIDIPTPDAVNSVPIGARV